MKERIVYEGGMRSLDSKDKLLITALKKNARASLVSLARDIGLSRSAAHDRLMRLEENGTIAAYTIEINDLDLFKTKAVFMVNFTDAQDNRVSAQRISKMAGIVQACCLSGEIDLIAYAECTDTNHLVNLREQISALKTVVTIRTHSVLSVNGR
ncbi:MAG: AsnC family transcriptional regulator [Robiginitomaculum sp.]|nr:MAG: AsnC family transcriptional regulator [Robiginitomaculum sp.]